MTDKRVLAFHYAWYGTPWGPNGCWQHWNHRFSPTEGTEIQGQHNPDIILNGRRHIGTALYPMDGVYDSQDPATVRRQLREAERAGIDGFMISWWGLDHRSNPVVDVFMDLAPADFVTIYYETAYTFRLRDQSRSQAVARITEDLIALLRAHADRPQWIKVDGRPLMVLYIVENYTVEEWQEIKRSVRQAGYDVYLLGDTYNVAYLEVMDGLHTYNPIGITRRGQDMAKVFAETSRQVHARGGLYAATVSPGFDNCQVTTANRWAVVPREDGHYYRMTWEAALGSDPDWVLICSFNEWGESSVIEPTLQFGNYYIEVTRNYSRLFKGS
ncbi:MAG: hypothetical protein FJZ90_15495 [Chloroflexi bacterium]|nr:hypothetical protein [Chloroflexota bacterium]